MYYMYTHGLVVRCSIGILICPPTLSSHICERNQHHEAGTKQWGPKHHVIYNRIVDAWAHKYR